MTVLSHDISSVDYGSQIVRQERKLDHGVIHTPTDPATNGTNFTPRLTLLTAVLNSIIGRHL